MRMFPQESLVGPKFRKGSNLYIKKIFFLVVGPLSKKNILSMIFKKWPEPHESQDKWIIKNCMFSAGQYRSTEKVYNLCIWKYYISKFIFDLNFFINFFIHFRPYPIDNFFLKKGGSEPLRGEGGTQTLVVRPLTFFFMCVFRVNTVYFITQSNAKEETLSQE